MRKSRQSRKAVSRTSQDIIEAIEKAWPDGVIQMTPDTEDSYFGDMYPSLRSSLLRIPGASLHHEREPKEPWDGAFDEDPPARRDTSYSYHLFFLIPQGEGFTYECEDLEPGEDGVDQVVQGEGHIGWAVAVSLVAPFAILVLTEKEEYQSGNSMDPDIEPHIFSLDGEPLDLEKHYGEMVGEDGLQTLRKLRGQITRVLESHKIRVLEGEVLPQPVPGLRAGAEVFLEKPITVQQAFFFQGL